MRNVLLNNRKKSLLLNCVITITFLSTCLLLAVAILCGIEKVHFMIYPLYLLPIPISNLFLYTYLHNSIRHQKHFLKKSNNQVNNEEQQIKGNKEFAPLHSHNVNELLMEALLGRETVDFDFSEIHKFLRNKTVMVTGGGGSIGSEICRQVAKAHPKSLIVLDIYENSAYNIQQELTELYQDQLELHVEIASVSDEERIGILFHKYSPNIVFHAAAHKHVPLMEACPVEAVKNNVFGTYNVVLAANRWKTEKFVLISSDKAVNPTNVMGASKCLCEMILQSMRLISKTEYVAVRFGNVLGSNGSVVPLFQRQIMNGGPVTITDKRIVRYFMTISEAAQLVLQAGAIAKSCEVFVLDMGEPVKIIDLAEKMIRLQGFEPYKEIQISEMGLRPGEKIYEELLTKSEELTATSHHKLFIEHQNDISPIELHEKLGLLQRALDKGTDLAMKRALKMAVPTYCDPEKVNNLKIASDSCAIATESELEAVAII